MRLITDCLLKRFYIILIGDHREEIYLKNFVTGTQCMFDLHVRMVRVFSIASPKLCKAIPTFKSYSLMQRLFVPTCVEQVPKKRMPISQSLAREADQAQKSMLVLMLWATRPV